MTDTVIDPGIPFEESPAHAPVSVAYRRYALWLLLAVYVVGFIDRQVINILAEPIKNDLHLADWQVGLLSGFAFGLIYTILGLPLARAADRHNRVWIISACLAAWSLFTGVCGVAQNFVQLVAARAGVGIGEAGCTPTSQALIADYAPKETRASSLAFFAMGSPIGSLLGLAIGGVMADYFGWRGAFLVVATPGLMLAIICLFTLKEPRKLIAARAAQISAASAGIRETLAHLAKKKAFWFLAWGTALRIFVSYGHAPFTASFFYRVHGADVTRLAAMFDMKPQTFIGIMLGVITGVSGCIGAWLGGAMADHASTRDLRRFGAVPAIAVLAATPIMIFQFLTPDTTLALAIGVLPGILGAMWYGPVYSSAQGMAPPHMRAMSSAILLFVMNMTGLVFGALIVGALSDVFNKGMHLGPAEGVRWALIISSLTGIVSAWLFWSSRNLIEGDMES